MPIPKPTQAELDRMVEQARQLMAKECLNWNPEIKKPCLRPAGHPGRHQWWYGLDGKVREWK